MPDTAPSRRDFLLRLLAAPLLGSVPLGAWAQVGRQYRIELVIFERIGYESRRFLETTARPLQPRLSGLGIGDGPARPSERGFELNHVVERVERSGQGRVLARLAWDQVGRDFGSAPWIRIQEGRYLGERRLERMPVDPIQPGPVGLAPIDPAQERYELEGRLRVWVGQFLHLETDLIFHAPPALPVEAADPVDDTGSAPDGFTAVPVRGSQRMNSGEDLFYLDHPVVGIIARVTRIDE
jgi:hypothetical protein